MAIPARIKANDPSSSVEHVHPFFEVFLALSAIQGVDKAIKATQSTSLAHIPRFIGPFAGPRLVRNRFRISGSNL